MEADCQLLEELRAVHITAPLHKIMGLIDQKYIVSPDPLREKIFGDKRGDRRDNYSHR